MRSDAEIEREISWIAERVLVQEWLPDITRVRAESALQALKWVMERKTVAEPSRDWKVYPGYHGP